MIRYRTLLASALVVATLGFALLFDAGASTPTQDPKADQSKGAASSPRGDSKMQQVTGSFDVKLVPQQTDGADPALARMTIDKQFHGGLEATSKGEMLAGSTATKNSAGYVAMEKVTGTLNGRKGSFLLQHSGTMNRGVPTLLITVVPDSGTDELVGLTGTLTIQITDAKHYYTFNFSLPDAK